MTINDDQNSQMFTSNGKLRDGIVTFTFKIPNDTSSGEYSVELSNNYRLYKVKKIFRIRDYNREAIQIETDLPYETYRPGEVVFGTFKATLKDGRVFDSKTYFTVTTNFLTLDENGYSNPVTFVSAKNFISTQGEGTFSVKIAENTTNTQTLLSFFLNFEELQYFHTMPLVIT